MRRRPPVKWEAFTLKVEKVLLYCLIAAVPFMIYCWKVDGNNIHPRKIREIMMYSLAVIVCAFLQKSRCLRHFIVWCVINWWMNFFYPTLSYVALTNVFSALVLYIALKFLIEKGYLSGTVILRIICVSALFQLGWMVLQKFNADPVFYRITAQGNPLAGEPMILSGWSGNSSLLGIYLAVTGFLFLHFFKIKRVPVFFFLTVIAAFLVKNATTLICFSAGGIFYVLNRYKIKLKHILFISVIISTLLLSFVFVKYPNFDRLYIWKKVCEDGTKLRPLIGCGLEAFREFYIVDKTGTPWREMHNDYLQIVLELGSIGIILFYSFIISRFVVFYREKRNNLQVCLMSGLVCFLVSAVSLFPFHIAQLSFTAILLWVCLESSYDEKDKTYILQSKTQVFGS